MNNLPFVNKKDLAPPPPYQPAVAVAVAISAVPAPPSPFQSSQAQDLHRQEEQLLYDRARQLSTERRAFEDEKRRFNQRQNQERQNQQRQNQLRQNQQRQNQAAPNLPHPVHDFHISAPITPTRLQKAATLSPFQHTLQIESTSIDSSWGKDGDAMEGRKKLKCIAVPCLLVVGALIYWGIQVSSLLHVCIPPPFVHTCVFRRTCLCRPPLLHVLVPPPFVHTCVCRSLIPTSPTGIDSN